MQIQKCASAFFLSGAIAVPLGTPAGWSEFKFDKIPANQVTYSAKGIQIRVDRSASPLIYKFEKVLTVTGFSAELVVDGDLNPPPAHGTIEEDSVFRLGLVTEGETRLNFYQRTLAPAWIKKLFSLVPEGLGVDKIYFYSVGREASQLGLTRINPKSELVSEEIVTMRKSGETVVAIEKILAAPRRIAALWISVDGDDTKSKFKTFIHKIVVQTQEL